ncbi:IPT/TIG domain-containing protein [Mangrovibacterium marinum]|uniref:IPT/TIG domain-containing protein n=1 Tax=Mangrovibacterium marinum TaxID=1639118 RepID=UPI002A189979|nr:IPT/TIG domain-containing protein [Mangrovibacterium marinum]
MKKTKICVLACFLLACLISCKDKDEDVGGHAYDPSKPVVVGSFYPESGNIRERIVIKGQNFGNDPSKVRVLFKDDITERSALVIGAAGEAIYCLAPRQNPGDNDIRVVIEDSDTIQADMTFRYSLTENISTIINGTGGWVNPAEHPVTDGKLSEAYTDYISGVAALGGGTGIVFGNSDAQYQNVRYWSESDDVILLLQQNFAAGKPAISEDKDDVYAVKFDAPYTIYRYSRENGWAPYRVGEISSVFESAGVLQSSSYLGSLTFGKESDRLYFCDSYGVFGYYDLTNQEAKIVNIDLEGIRDYSGMGTGGYASFEKMAYMVYDKRKDCFYYSAPWSYAIYKIDGDGQHAELWAGNPSRSQVIDGTLLDCAFKMPHSLTLDDDGNIYVCDGSRNGGFVIRKISTDGFVSTVAGTVHDNLPGSGDRLAIDGAPLQARFIYPVAIDYDGEGAFYIGEGWGRRLRKYAVE